MQNQSTLTEQILSDIKIILILHSNYLSGDYCSTWASENEYQVKMDRAVRRQIYHFHPVVPGSI